MRRLVPGALLASAVSAGLLLAGLAPASAADPTGPVSATPANTPQLDTTGAVEQVRQLVQCGGTMYAVGTFTSIKQGSTRSPVNNAFSFSATAPYTLTAWAPNVNGDRQLDRLQRHATAPTPTSAGSSPRSTAPRSKNIAEVSTAAPAPWSRRSGTPRTAQVETLLGVGGHILAGGYFTTINGSTANPYMASLNPTTGKDDGFLSLNISGQLPVPRRRQQPDPGLQPVAQPRRHADLVEGDFTSVGGCRGSRSSCWTWRPARRR